MIYILTIKGREHLLKQTIDSLLKLNISKDKIKPIYGFTEFKNKNCMKTFMEIILPLMIEDIDECFYVEDGSIFVKSPYECYKGHICWLGYIKLLSDYWIGSKCIYFSKYVLNDIISSKYNLQHLDNYLRKYFIKNKYEKPSEQSICYQLFYDRANGTEKQRITKDKYIQQQRQILLEKVKTKI